MPTPQQLSSIPSEDKPHAKTRRHCDSHPPLVAPYLFCPCCGIIEQPSKPKPRMSEDVRVRMRRQQITKIFRHLHGHHLPDGDMASIDALSPVRWQPQSAGARCARISRSN
jgi:hypothetical protein